jgi:hypothetical protein
MMYSRYNQLFVSNTQSTNLKLFTKYFVWIWSDSNELLTLFVEFRRKHNQKLVSDFIEMCYQIINTETTVTY